MLNHTYTSVKNANLVDCGKKQHITSQPTTLLKDNFLGEFRTELDKKKVLSNLGIATDLSLEWEYIKGDISRSVSLMQELDARTKYVSDIDGYQKSIIEGIKHLETFIGGEEKGEEEQNSRLDQLESSKQELVDNLSELKDYLKNTIEVNLNDLTDKLGVITTQVNNITELIQVSNKQGNALVLLSEDNPGLYVPDLSENLDNAINNIESIQSEITTIKGNLDDFVTKEDLGGDGDFNFISETIFNDYSNKTDQKISSIESDLAKTVKTGEDGHVDTLYVNAISKNNNNDNIKITDSFEVETGIPLDVRFVVKNIEELHSLKPSVCYPGMGVIVSNQSSLYILREPENGIITEDYIKDSQGINWKCPEDLVIEVVTQEEYDSKLESGTINPHMFYYIHEEIVEEPLRKDFDSDEEYTEALNKWLRVLQQKYMSAVWGQEIESLVASKASTTAVKSLENEIQRIFSIINDLQGGTENINLKDLNDQVIKNYNNIDNLINEESGTIPSIQKDLTNLQSSVVNNYVTKEEIITDSSNIDYIFVKKSEFTDYKTQHDLNLSNQLNTNNVITNKITLGLHNLTSDDSNLLFNENEIAFLNQVPVIEVLDNESFESKEDKNDDTYYMVYDVEDKYTLDSEFTNYKTQQSQTISNISELITKTQNNLGDLNNLNTDNKTTLVIAINELFEKINTLTQELSELKEQVSSGQTE